MGNGKFLSILSVENIKLWKRFSTKLMILIMVAIVFGLMGLIKAEMSISESRQKTSQDTTTSANWKQDLKAENIGLQQQINDMEKSKNQSDKTQIDSDKFQKAENEYDIRNNIKPVSKSSTKHDFWYYVANYGFGTFVALLAIIACSGLVAGEFSDGTMKTMISRPFARWQILTAKFIAVFLYSLVLMVVSYLSLMASTAIYFGTGGMGNPLLLWVGGNIVKTSGFAGSLATSGLDFLSVLVYLIFAFALSAIFRSRALATGVSIFLMLGGSYTLLLAQHFSWGKYIFFADTSFSTFITSGAPFYGITLGLALVICAIYCIGFICAGYLTFAKRDIN